MDQYTETMILAAEISSPDDDDYEENLLKISAMFRGFDQALTVFLGEHGYSGDLNDVPAKVQFLREKFKAANVKQPRDFKEWFIPKKQFSRDTAFSICFAFGLNIDGTKDFFLRVQFERAFNCHTVKESVYYFCLKNALSYSEAQEIIAQFPAQKRAKKIPGRDALYTKTIIEYIDSIDDKEKLICYIKDNIEDFQYNNVTAGEYIRELWEDISKKGGLAEKEGTILDRTHNQDQEQDQENYVIAGANASTWRIFAQILGMTNYMEKEYAAKYDRSLTTVLSDNKLLPLKAAYCFPSRQSIDKILRGETVGDNEIIRKMLIFLTFYKYWAKIITDKNDAFYEARKSDSVRCLDTINNRLLDAGYPELYAGNAYDWIFMWSLNDDQPLAAFRRYMGEVFAVSAEQ
ncbi:MAG: hypothetical protein LUG52_07200 [Clostridia bacterium]|nr:hypothetical protein [Clostridia bacterium]